MNSGFFTNLVSENNNLKKCNKQLVDDIEAYKHQILILKSMIKIDNDIINEYEEEKSKNNCILCQFKK